MSVLLQIGMCISDLHRYILDFFGLIAISPKNICHLTDSNQSDDRLAEGTGSFFYSYALVNYSENTSICFHRF